MERLGKQREEAYLDSLRERVRQLATQPPDKRNFHFMEGFEDVDAAITKFTPEDLYILNYVERGELEVSMYEAYREKVSEEIRREWETSGHSGDDREGLGVFIKFHPRDRLVQYIGNELNKQYMARQLREMGVEVPPPSS